MTEEKSITEYSFEDLNINDDLLRGIYSYGFEKPSKFYRYLIQIKCFYILIKYCIK